MQSRALCRCPSTAPRSAIAIAARWRAVTLAALRPRRPRSSAWSAPGGIEAWLVHEPAVPLIAIDFAFPAAPRRIRPTSPASAYLDRLAARRRRRRSRRQDLPRAARAQGDRAELSAPTATTSAARCARCRKTATRLRRSAAGADRAALRCRRRRAHPRADPLGAAPRRPRARPISPASAGGSTAFPGHPYGRPVNGTLESVPTITVDDLQSLCAPRAGARHPQDRHGRRHRRRDRRRPCSTTCSARCRRSRR